GRYDHVAVWTGDRMIVWGGIALNGDPLGDGAAYDPVAKQWTPISELGAPSGRALATAVWTGEKMIAFGGLNQSGVLGDGGACDPATDTWKRTAFAGGPSERLFHTAVWTGTEMIVWGGFADFDLPGPPPTALGDGAAYDPTTDRWRPLAIAGAP